MNEVAYYFQGLEGIVILIVQRKSGIIALVYQPNHVYQNYQAKSLLQLFYSIVSISTLIFLRYNFPNMRPRKYHLTWVITKEVGYWGCWKSLFPLHTYCLLLEAQHLQSPTQQRGAAGNATQSVKRICHKKVPWEADHPSRGQVWSSPQWPSGRVCAASSGPPPTMAHPGEMEVHDGQPTPEEGHNPKREQQR